MIDQFLLATVITMASRKPCKVATPRSVAVIVRPILRDANEALLSDSFWDSPAEKRFEKRWEALANNNARAADEALAVLLHFYIGEHSGEELMDEAVQRGKRMLPLLRRYQRCKPMGVAHGLRAVDREIPDLYEVVIAEVAKGK